MWEWVWDWYLDKYETLAPVDPIGPATGAKRVIRGGSLNDAATYARVAGRYAVAPTYLSGTVGFRVVRSYP